MSLRHNSTNKRTGKPAHVIRNKQSFDDQLRRISEENEDNSLIIPLSLLLIAPISTAFGSKRSSMNDFVRILLNGNTVMEFWLKSWFFSFCAFQIKDRIIPYS